MSDRENIDTIFSSISDMEAAWRSLTIDGLLGADLARAADPDLRGDIESCLQLLIPMWLEMQVAEITEATEEGARETMGIQRETIEPRIREWVGFGVPETLASSLMIAARGMAIRGVVERQSD
jgi:hypothetical protein